MTSILQRDHAFPAALAAETTGQFLRAFRHCPDNEPIPLDTWRHRLWSDALPATHRHLASELYPQWLELRFRYLALTTDTVALLQQLHVRGYRLALITNGPSAAQWEKVQRLNVAGLFDCVLVSGDLPFEKPDVRIFEAAGRYLGVSAAECVMVGDKLETDIQGAIEALLGGSVWIPLSASELAAPRTIEPTHIIGTVGELLHLLPPLSTNEAFRRTKTGAAKSGANLIGAAAAKGISSRRGPINRRVASLPDLDSGNSNSSDGS